MELKALIKDIPDFPQPGIIFRDITTLLQDPAGLQHTIAQITEQGAPLAADYIAGIESRGFIFGMPVAHQLQTGFIPIRKGGKLPREVHSIAYELEYGQDQLEVHQDAFKPNSRVLIVDDLLATGGTAAAAAKLIDKAGAKVVGFAFVIELNGLAGRNNLPSDIPIISLVQY
ncbi:MAG: adenine phosphoribosyltransferase AprT [Phormidesmis priestleyi Ana]|uniref:Adenine phosphoribosyltransferase n=1 Tax=Phormidesmis priestleyi Ana TaxID=1666911 RepID=A0A0P8BFZ4_9CYAN|nr:MAG: adenine phosphoribosyltransferase AprT [Phormidesmis priestleyi Ana]